MMDYLFSLFSNPVRLTFFCFNFAVVFFFTLWLFRFMDRVRDHINETQPVEGDYADTHEEYPE